MQKIDFTAEADADKPFENVKVGQKLDLVQQEDGSWACTRQEDSNDILCAVPAAAADSIRQQPRDATPSAVVRSVKRCPDNPDAVVSMQIRISFSTQGKVLAQLHFDSMQQSGGVQAS